MAQNASQTTAKIYRFPSRPTVLAGRSLRGGVVERASLPYARTECGSGWYHEAAIEAEKPLKP